MLCPHCRKEAPEDGKACPHCGAILFEPADSAQITGKRQPGLLDFGPGQRFGDRYTIIEEIGAGGQAHVFKALERSLKHTVALKLVPPELARQLRNLERFKRELTLAQQVTHRNVCRVHDIGERGGIHFISMEYIDGHSLHDWIQAVGRLSPQQTVNVGRQICAGLGAIHDQGIVHRDLKPRNVMLDRSGRVVVMDFGLAYRPDAETMTASGEALGTLAYLSPEQARGERVDARSDVYALGLVLFEMLTGRRPPADGNALPLALRDASDRCPPPSRTASEVPPALDAVVLRCLERDPGKRYASAHDVSVALAEAEQSLSSESTRPARAGVSRSALAWTASLVALLVLGLVLAYFVSPRSGGQSGPAPLHVAVLPLEYQGPTEQAYLAELLPIIWTRELAESGRVRAAPFDSSRSFSSEENPGRVAEQLGVDQLLLGKLELTNSDYHFSMRLYDRKNEGAIWSQSRRGDLDTILDQAQSLAAEVRAEMGLQGPGKVLSTSPVALEAYLEGKSYLEGWDVEKNPERAVQAFRKAVDADEAFAEAYAGWARSLWTKYSQTRDPEFVEPALERAQKAVELDSSLPEAHLALGEIQLGMGRSAEAAASLEKARSLAPANDAICRRIAQAFASLGRQEEAERLYAEAIALRPSYWENHLAPGVFFLESGDMDRAKESFREVIRLRPESDLGYGNLAVTHIMAGEFEEAEPLLKAALNIRPTGRGHNNLGFVYYSTGRFEQAAEQFKEATRLNPHFPESHHNLGDALRQLGQSEEARGAYERAIELSRSRLEVNPSEGVMRSGLAMALAAIDRCAAAAQEASRGLETSGGSPIAHYYVAIASVLCDEREMAIEHTLDAIRGGVVADVQSNPDLRPLLEHPRIQEALR